MKKIFVVFFTCLLAVAQLWAQGKPQKKAEKATTPTTVAPKEDAKKAVASDESAPKNETPKDDWKKFVAPEGISLEYPSDWELSENDMGARVFLKAPLREGGGVMFGETMYLMVQDLAGGTDTLGLDVLTDGFDRQATQFYPACKIESFRHIDFYGVPAKELIYTATMGEYRLRWVNYHFIKNKKMYIYTLNVEDKHYLNIKPITDRIFRSLKVKVQK